MPRLYIFFVSLRYIFNDMKNHWPFVLWILLASITCYAQNDTVIFSAGGGFYEEVLTLELYNYYPQNHIRYTTNGSNPTAQSPLYEEPLLLDSTKYSKSDIYTIVDCPVQDFYLPDSVQHCIVIRAAVFDENDSCVSGVRTNSYFIRSLGCDTHGLPVVSLCSDSLGLFDYETGIFVPGIHYDPLDPDWTGNYYQEGREWERRMNVEFYELDNTGINQQAGLRTHGGNGRRLQQKCLKMYAREEYGKKRFKHKFFETIPLSNFKHLVLKPFAASWDQSGVNDHICNQIASQLNIEALASSPVVLYLNGEYWGIYYIHERPDERYLEDHFDVDIEQVNLIWAWNPFVDCGTLYNFLELFHWMENADLSDARAYAYLKTQMDVDNFIDYQIFEMFAENDDWPANNMRCWQEGNSKWRWIFFDGDACLRWMTFHAFENAVDEGDALWPTNWKATLFFRRLLENDEFREQFNSRFRELLNTAFSYATTKPIFESIKATIIAEVPFQSERYGRPTNMAAWNDDMGRINCFLMRRADNLDDHIYDLLVDLPEKQAIGVWCYPNPSSGEIRILMDAEHMDACEIAIFDVLGHKVFTQSCLLSTSNNEIVIHPDLKAGVYVLKIGHSFHKIIRQ